MLDFNHILLFVAILSPAVVLVRTWRRAALNRSWRFAAVAVLSITGIAWALAPYAAGYVGGAAWLLLLFVPAAGLRKASELAAEERFAAARRLLSFVGPFHPVRRVREERSLVRAMELAQAGNRDAATSILAPLQASDSRAGRQATAQAFRISGDWSALRRWCEETLPKLSLGEDPSLLPLYFRSLGELGARDELVRQFAARAPVLLASPLHRPVFDACVSILLAFCGRSGGLARFFTGTARARKDAQQFWLATSEAAAGDLAAARSRLERLRKETRDALIQADCAERLSRSGQLPPLLLTAYNEATVDRFERHAAGERGSLLGPQSSRATAAVVTLIALNVAAFLLEIFFGGATNPITLHRLGALEPIAVLGAGQYWRLLSALFLHYGLIHLLFNLYALYVLGPALERWIGSARFAICYLLSGIGSSAGVVLLWRLGVTQADLLVGASGSVMGIVGAWAGILLGHRHAPLARQRLFNIIMIVVMQTAFDFFTPQVSMAAHLSGLVSGFILGLFIAPRREL